MLSFLFDLFCSPSGMVLYLITGDGRRVRVRDRFAPSFFVSGPRELLSPCLQTLGSWKDIVTVIGPSQRLDFWSGELQDVVEVRIDQPFNWARQHLPRLYRQHPDVQYYNADLAPEQHYCFERRLVPAGWCELTVDDEGWVTEIVAADNEWGTELTLPELVTMRLDGGGMLYGGQPRLDWISAEVDGQEHYFDGSDPAETLASLNRLLELHDPDVILTNGGDSYLMPLLLLLQQHARDWQGDAVPLRLDREPPPEPREIRLEGRSYFSYGRVLYQAPDYPLYGRWHLDEDNSFMVEKTGMHGLIEVARVSKLPIQRIGRRSIGTGITSIQLDLAYREGFLIPWKKAVPEAWKSASQLLNTDRGGLVYQPLTGAYEDVIEIDFVSMYPTIMSHFNVSPETVNCRCCRNGRVPEIGYHICEKRHGLVARALAPIIAKRVEYKAKRNRARQEQDEDRAFAMDSRQTALKWLLVCCFGYLGYRNARFGRIEAHEAVTAYARDRLLVAREVCERHGFRVLHAIVDCFWCQRDPERAHLGRPTPAQVEALCRDILRATELPIALEGIYKWIAFLPSRVNPMLPVPTRFFGLFEDGTMKLRGIESRRHDLPPLVREMQLHALELLRRADTLEDYRGYVPELLAQLAETERALYCAEVPRERLFITRHLSQEPDQYRSNNMVAIAVRQAQAAGIPVRAGQSVSYLIVSQFHPDPMQRICLAPLLQPETLYDPESYIRLLRRAFQTLLYPAGVTLEDTPPPPPDPARRRDPLPVREQREQLDLFW